MTAAAAHEQASGHPAIPPSASAPARAWYAVVVFCIAQVVSTIDRGMLALVVEPVRADLLISDLQIALLQGFAFAAFYVTAGLPLGLLADRFNRQRLLIAGIVIWSCATVGGGLARDFGHMFASRLFIGVGEAVLAPCAVTMISDLFPASRRGRPMSVYVFGTMIAYGLGSLVSGYVLQLAPQGAFDAIAPLRGLAPWRIAYILVGIAGLALVPLLLPLRDPRRMTAATATAVDMEPPSGRLWTTLAHFVERRRLFLPLYGSLALFALGASAASGWGAVLLVTSHGNPHLGG